MMSVERVWAPRVLSLLRVVIGALYLEHGTAKLFHFPYVAAFAHPLPPLIHAAGYIEVVGSVLVILGLLTRAAAFILSGEMAVAYFMVFAAKSPFPLLNGGEVVVLYCFFFFYLAFAGGGAWSLDQLLRRRSVSR